MEINNKYYDEKIWENVLKHCNDREIILFGAGTSATTVLGILKRFGKKVSVFLDNDKNKWGSFIDDIEVKDPLAVKKEHKNCYIIIISQHGRKIGKQLDDLGLNVNIDYYDAYEIVFKYLKLDKYIQLTQKFCNFIGSIKRTDFNRYSNKENKKIGIVMIPGIRGHMGWYSCAIFLVMKYFGYNVSLIIDELTNIEDLVIYKGVTEDLSSITSIVMEELEKKIGEVDVIYIRDNKEGSLSNYEKEQIKNLAIINARWQKSRWDNISRNTNEEDLRIDFERILSDNMISIKNALQNEYFDIIDVHSGIHKQRGLYMLYGMQNNIRVSTYDGYNHSTDKPCDHHYDVLKLLNNQWFSEEEKKIILKRAKMHFYDRLNSVSSDNICEAKFQISKEDLDLQYDILVPLNIMWDAATLGVDDLFSRPDEWLDETLEFILENTDATVLIREHPAQTFWKNYNYGHVLGHILEKYKKENRIRIVLANEEVNTYRCLDKCKLVLPYTSTVGIEAVIQGKPIVMHTKCFYSYRSFANKVNSKDMYFNKIKEGLNKQLIVSEDQIEDALLVYAMLFNAFFDFNTDFVISNDSWLDYKFSEFIQKDYIDLIRNIIGENTPLAYQNICIKWLNKLN